MLRASRCAARVRRRARRARRGAVLVLALRRRGVGRRLHRRLRGRADEATGTRRGRLDAHRACPRRRRGRWSLAFGITLVFAGLVTHALVSVVGVVADARRRRSAGSARCCPSSTSSACRCAPLAERASPSRRRDARGAAAARRGRASRAAAARDPSATRRRQGRPRRRRRRWRCWPSLYGVIVHGSLWYPINLLAAAAMPRMARADAARARARSTARRSSSRLVIHALISMLVGLLYARHAADVPAPPDPLRRRRSRRCCGRACSGRSLGVVNPALNARIDWPWFVASQIAFGLAAGLVVARTRAHRDACRPAARRARRHRGAGAERDRRTAGESVPRRLAASLVAALLAPAPAATRCRAGRAAADRAAAARRR